MITVIAQLVHRLKLWHRLRYLIRVGDALLLEDWITQPHELAASRLSDPGVARVVPQQVVLALALSEAEVLSCAICATKTAVSAFSTAAVLAALARPRVRHARPLEVCAWTVGIRYLRAVNESRWPRQHSIL